MTVHNTQFNWEPDWNRTQPPRPAEASLMQAMQNRSDLQYSGFDEDFWGDRSCRKAGQINEFICLLIFIYLFKVQFPWFDYMLK